jgi:phage tail P2-like protein
MGKSLAETAFIDLLPSSISGDDTIIAAARALDGVLEETRAGIENVLLFSRIDEIEEPLLSELAWQLHVDYWDPDFSLVTKRELIRNAIPRHRKKGTPAAIEAMLRAVAGSGYVSEWFEYGGDPYWFRVEMNLAEVSLSFMELGVTETIIDICRNTRSHCEPVRFVAEGEPHSHVLAATIIGETITVYPEES